MRDLAANLDPARARGNPIDGAILLAAMDEELEELELGMRAAQEHREQLLQRKRELENERDVAGSCTVCIIGAVEVEELEDDDDYEDAVEDIRAGCSRSGEV